MWVIFHSTNERSHWTKDNISSPNLNSSILLKNANLNNSILLKNVSYFYCYCSATNGIFHSESRAFLKNVLTTYGYAWPVEEQKNANDASLQTDRHQLRTSKLPTNLKSSVCSKFYTIRTLLNQISTATSVDAMTGKNAFRVPHHYNNLISVTLSRTCAYLQT